jgi:hypothetical protein
MSKDNITRFNGYTIAEGQLISDRVQRIVMAIKEYEPEIEVQWIPDRQAKEEGTPQFKVVHHQADGFDFTLFHVKSEEEFDETVLLRIIENDQRNGQVSLSAYEAWEQTKKLMERQIYLDHMEQAQDMAAHILATHKNTYKVNNDLTIKEGIPFNANKLNDPKFFSHSPKDK